MIINDLDISRPAWRPRKAKTPLFVDADAVATFAVAFEGFQSVGRGNAKFVQFHHGVQDAEFTTGDGLDLGGQSS